MWPVASSSSSNSTVLIAGICAGLAVLLCIGGWFAYLWHRGTSQAQDATGGIPKNEPIANRDRTDRTDDVPLNQIHRNSLSARGSSSSEGSQRITDVMAAVSFDEVTDGGQLPVSHTPFPCPLPTCPWHKERSFPARHNEMPMAVYRSEKRVAMNKEKLS